MKTSFLNTLGASLLGASLIIATSGTCWAQDKKQSDIALEEITPRALTNSVQNLDENVRATAYTELFAQVPATWCYTNYGAYPMVVALPPGVSCRVNVAFPPYVLFGVTGY